MSKKGRAEPRAILFMVTLSAIGHNPLIKELYQKRLEQGMHRMAAIGVCMHKILRIVYGMLKHKTFFDPNIDKANQAKSQNNRQWTQKDTKRRLQKFDDNAPISRRQQQKRRELKQAATKHAKSTEPKIHSEQAGGDWVDLGTLLKSYPQFTDNVTKKR